MGLIGEKFEYASGVFTRHFFQLDRARKLAALANSYLARGWKVYLRGHSNGCAVILMALDYITEGYLAGIQLIAAACEADCEAVGVNHAIRTGIVDKVVLCCSASDRALWAARISHPILNVIGNAYGSLGFTGPVNVADEIEHRVRTHWRTSYGHGDWVSAANLQGTMELLHQ
jgi:predicted alpha/beta hydrolase family esterase